MVRPLLHQHYHLKNIRDDYRFMNEASVLAASDLLFKHWVQGSVISGLPIDIRPATREQGYAIQARLNERSRSPIYGWKVAATSAAGQAHIGVDGPIAGRILAERVVPCAGVIPAGLNHMAVAEIEFAFRMSRNLDPRRARFSVKEILAAVETLHVAIEIPDSRFEDFANVGAPQLIADNACAHYFVAAEASKADWRSIDLSTHRVIGRIEGGVEREGSGASVLGDPRIALTWLANELSRLGITLQKGQTVTTGTCIPPLAISPGDQITADFGSLGTATVRIG